MIGPLLGVAIAYVVYYIFSYYLRASKLPPGPFPLPLIGNLYAERHQSQILRYLRKLSRKYGGMYTVNIPFPVVNISDYSILKEAFQSDDYNGRIQSVLSDMISYTKNGGIVFANGDSWKEQRKTALHILRDFGMGRNAMVGMVQQSAAEYLRYLKKQNHLESIDMRWPIQLFVANIINEICFGFRYAYDDCDALIEYVEGVAKLFNDGAKSPLFLVVMMFPWLKHVPILKEHAYDLHERNFRTLQKYIVREVGKAKATFKMDEEPTCFVHAYLQKAEKDPATFSEGQLLSCCSEIFLAGQETTTTTLRWAMLFMADNQDVQDKLRAEILFVVGPDRMVDMSDKANMPYASATVHEIQRSANISAFNVFVMRTATVDTKINGQSIPKGTAIHWNSHEIHSCDPIFEEPERFRPERYLHEDGVTLRKELVERTIPFGIGKRACVGEGLARVEIFIGLVATLQHYRVLPVDGGSVDLEPVFQLTQPPKHQSLKLVPT